MNLPVGLFVMKKLLVVEDAEDDESFVLLPPSCQLLLFPKTMRMGNFLSAKWIE